MKVGDLKKYIALGEDSTRQFKVDVHNTESLASEMAAFANSDGGTIYLGVADDGSRPGLDKADVARINQLISNAASQFVKSRRKRLERSWIVSVSRPNRRQFSPQYWKAIRKVTSINIFRLWSLRRSPAYFGFLSDFFSHRMTFI